MSNLILILSFHRAQNLLRLREFTTVDPIVPGRMGEVRVRLQSSAIGQISTRRSATQTEGNEISLTAVAGGPLDVPQLP